jgi:GDP/UDP-N,N'-diacetylbacillosamine 2-epimerase (hydrolysing)
MKIAVLTTSRADYGLLEGLIGRIYDDPDVKLCLMVSGSHVCPEFGLTLKEIKFPISERIEIILSSDTPTAVAKGMGLGNISFSEALERRKPDWIILLGDRFETFSMAAVAHTLRIPIVHISGGEVTRAAIDDGFRHCITKLSYLHFAYHKEYRNRIIQLGEHPERVFDVGCLSLEGIEKYKFAGMRKGYLISIHPETLQHRIWQRGFVDVLLAHLAHKKEPLYFCKSNGDEGSRVINKKITDFVGMESRRRLLNLKRGDFLKLLGRVKCIIGNSSAGIYEAPPLGTPTINIGNRQDGRIKSDSIIDCRASSEGLRGAFSRLNGEEYLIDSPPIVPKFEGGPVSERILNVIKKYDSVNLQKGFYDAK